MPSSPCKKVGQISFTAFGELWRTKVSCGAWKIFTVKLSKPNVDVIEEDPKRTRLPNMNPNRSGKPLVVKFGPVPLGRMPLVLAQGFVSKSVTLKFVIVTVRQPP